MSQNGGNLIDSFVAMHGGSGGSGSPASGTGIINSSSAGGDTTGSASPVTSIGSTGSGIAFSIMPPYLVVNIWKRTS